MYTYTFSGKVYPERVSFSVGIEIPINFKHPDFDVVEIVKLNFNDSLITAKLETETDYSKHQKCNLDTLGGFVEESARAIVDAYCYVKSYFYDVEITDIVCLDLGIKYLLPVWAERNIVKDKEQANIEFTKLLSLLDRPERSFLRDILADFRRAGKYSSMTAGFCFRAIETVRKFYFEDQNILKEDKRRKLGWEKLNQVLGFQESDFDEIKKFALPNRHGEYLAMTYVERERIMNFTRSFIDKFFTILTPIA